jgi:hypothetical protein
MEISQREIGTSQPQRYNQPVARPVSSMGPGVFMKKDALASAMMACHNLSNVPEDLSAVTVSPQSRKQPAWLYGTKRHLL